MNTLCHQPSCPLALTMLATSLITLAFISDQLHIGFVQAGCWFLQKLLFGSKQNTTATATDKPALWLNRAANWF